MQELYKNTLVDLDNEQIIQQSLNTATISSLGKNERQILVLTRGRETAYIHDENLGFIGHIESLPTGHARHCAGESGR